MNTLEQAQSELQKAQAAVEAAKEIERQARQAAEKKAQEEAQAKEREKVRVLLEGVADRLKTHHKIEVTIGTKGESLSIIFPGEPAYPRLSQSWRSENVTVDSGYGGPRSQTYARKSDGSYNIEKIADKMAEVYQHQISKEKSRERAVQNSKESSEIVKRLRALVPDSFPWLSIYSSESDGQRVKLKFEKSMTEEEASRFIAALKSADLLS